jgi:creatinine amidohydrolase
LAHNVKKRGYKMGYSIFDETIVDMAWPDIEKAAKERAVVLLPIGVIEEHGPHMGLAVDIYCSYLICKQTKGELEVKGINTLIAPPYYWGINTATGSFAGSFTVRKSTMKAMIYDLLASLMRWGFTHVFIMNWHGEHEHNVAILETVEEVRLDTGVRAYCILQARDVVRFKLSGKEPHILILKDQHSKGAAQKYLEIHADSLETGIMARYFPDQVNTDMAKSLNSSDLTMKDLTAWRQGWSDARKVTPLGYFGDPANFDAEAAKKVVESKGKETAKLIESFIKGRELRENGEEGKER